MVNFLFYLKVLKEEFNYFQQLIILIHPILILINLLINVPFFLHFLIPSLFIHNFHNLYFCHILVIFNIYKYNALVFKFHYFLILLIFLCV